MSPPAKRKRHVSVGYIRGKVTGLGKRKQSSNDLRQTTTQEATGPFRVRRLGDVVTDVDSGTSLLCEYETRDSELQVLRKKVLSMEKLLTANVEKANDQEQKLILMQNSLREVKQVGVTLHFVSMRAFADFVLHALYDKAGQSHLDSKERAKWLSSSELESFINSAAGKFLAFPHGKIQNQPGSQDLFRKMRLFSKMISKDYCHSSCAVNVALALGKDEVVSAMGPWGQEAIKSFEAVFSITPEILRKQFEENSHDSKHTELFKLGRVVKEHGGEGKGKEQGARIEHL